MRKLHDYFPTANKRLLGFAGIGVAFLLLVFLLAAFRWWQGRDTKNR